MNILIIGIADEHSIAAGCAQAFHAAGARLAITYKNEKARPFVAPVAERCGAELLLPFDVTDAAQHDGVFAAIAQHWTHLDAVVHAIAFAPKADLQGRVVDCSREGFATAMDISCHSLLRVIRSAEPLMPQGGSITTMSYYGAEKVVANYNLMGPVKAALEAAVRYAAAELIGCGIRVNALSPGPIATRAASGLAHFDELLAKAASVSPHPVEVSAVGEAAVFLAGAGARHITGQVLYVDNGAHIRG